jgi:glycosyltransferase involved in cell wall biosynthesis
MGFVNTLIEQGYEVHTIAPVDEYTDYLKEAGCIHHPLRMDSRGANPIKDSALIVELFLIYRRIKPDVILHYTIKPNVYGTLAAALLKIPVVNNVCGLGTVFLKENIVSSVALMLYKLSFRFATKVYFQNDDDRQLFLDKKLVDAEIVDILPGSGIDLKRFLPTDYKRNESFTFLLISRLITDKGILEYIEAIEKLRQEGFQARYQLLGAIDERHKRGIKATIIDEWIKNQTVEYLGTTEDVRPYIAAADCVVLPSYREGTPRTLLEAASSAKPIIATDVPGCNHVVKNDFNGLLCKLKDADDLAEKMKLMASHTDETLQRYGQNGRSTVEAMFDESIVINSYLKTIQSLKNTA